MQLLQRMEGGRGGLLVGDGAKMDDLKNTGFRRKLQGDQGEQDQPSRRTRQRQISKQQFGQSKLVFISYNGRLLPPVQICAAFQNRKKERKKQKTLPRVEKRDSRCVFMQPTRCETPISQIVYVNTSQFSLVWT